MCYCVGFAKSILLLLLFGVAPSLGDCNGVPTVLLEQYDDSLANGNYEAANALNPYCGDGGYWLGTRDKGNVGFTLDYGKVIKADGFHLRNDPNRNSKDR